MTRIETCLGFTLMFALCLPPASRIHAQDVHPKDPTIAFALSGMGSIIPGGVVYYRLTDSTTGLDGKTFAVLVAGIVVGPALGHVYTENYDRVWGGITVRLLSGIASTAGAYVGILTALGGGNPILGALLFTGGIIVAGTSAVIDIVRAPPSALMWNERHGLAVNPTYNPQVDARGVSISLSF